jgi:acetyl esterase
MALDAPTGEPILPDTPGRGGTGGPPDAETLTQLRETLAGLTSLPTIAFEGAIDELTIPTRAGSVPARHYRPAGIASPAPVFVFFHGGGFVSGSIDSHDNLCRELAAVAGAAVVSVEYRLAPEHPFPAGVEDAFDATAWVSASAAELDIAADRMAVAGDSAGGCLATAVALQARDNGGPALALQFLAYPKIDFVNDHPSHHESFGALGINLGMARLFDSSYLPDPTLRHDPLASPLAVADLEGLPPAIIVSAARDTLRDEAELYGRRLHKSGVTVATVRAMGLLHGFLNLTPIQPAGRLMARSVYAAAGLALRDGM